MSVYRKKTKMIGNNYFFQRQFDSDNGIFWITIFAKSGMKILDCQPSNSEDKAFRLAQSALSQIIKARKEIVPV
ncbi:MAG: hypothetical protein DWQ07_19935 [Chloroflexi bacterium]|nr:MAG: hypothetical protein DWQ07_19935 [Chloroflexota bacterium]MBL1194354.1 hypothetical protein [Chloroflexota bacterium]NOH11643.1 hypothetical protein [Chloroflexota bacterium]